MAKLRAHYRCHPTFATGLCLVCVFNKASYPQAVGETFGEVTTSYPSASTAHCLFNEKKTQTVVLAFNFKGLTEGEKMGLIAHECMHVWQHWKREFGAHTPSKEFEAYMVQTFVEAVVTGYEQFKQELVK